VVKKSSNKFADLYSSPSKTLDSSQNEQMASTMSSLKYWTSPLQAEKTKTSDFSSSFYTSPIKDQPFMNTTTSFKLKEASQFNPAESNVTPAK